MAVNGRSMSGANGDAERDPGLARLYREAAGEMPPAHLDAAILAAARREAGARPRALAPALRRWYVPVSIAAVVIVSVSLVILVRDEERMLMRDEGILARKEPKVPEEERRRTETAAAQPAQPLQAEAERRDAQPAAAPDLLRRQESRDEARPAMALGKAESEERARREPEPATAPPRVAEAPAAPALADAVTAGKAAAAPAVPSGPPAARSAPDAPQAKPMARGMLLESLKQDRPPVWQGFDKEPPEKWLARIEELRKEGRAADAEEMLSEFRRRFPEHPVPSASK